jgi:hypothetical protein
MTEKEMRAALSSLMTDLDRKARELAQSLSRNAKNVVVPMALGAALGMGAGCSDSTELYGIPSDQGVDGKSDAIARPDMAYGVPDMGADSSTDSSQDASADIKVIQDIIAGPDSAYGVPWDRGVVPPYMAPDMGADSAPIPPYMAPDAGPTPDYMAPDLGDKD